MAKDVLYIDVEDDITAIIGKVKASKESVIALVPPKRIGVLQSAVNLRLLARTAKQSDKHLALITGNSSLVALAASAKIPVAKTLQDTPELAAVKTVPDDSENDIIDGASLPIGDHMSKDNRSDADDRSAAMAAALASAPRPGDALKKPKVKKSGPKVPNFDTFRKKAILIGILAVLLIGFLIWAIFFAARATVVISANTNSSSINAPVTITSTGATNAENGTIRAITEEQSADKSQTFTATGQRDVGSKATGTVQFSTRDTEALGTTIPAGTTLRSSSGQAFTTNQSVTISFDNRRGASTGITAAENGSSYNAASGNVSGAPGGISATITSPTSGGVSRTVTVVTQEDVQRARQALVDENTDQIRAILKDQFGDDVTVVDESFGVDYGNITTAPNVGEEAGQATLSTRVTYRLYGVSRNELDSYIDAFLKNELDEEEDQRVYDNGASDVTFQEATASENGATATLIATAQVGPRIEDDQVKDLARGKRYGEIQQSIESIQGVESVDVRFFPFWVNSVPNDTSRITVDFNLQRND